MTKYPVTSFLVRNGAEPMKKSFNPMHFFWAVTGLTLVVNIAGYFLLPDEIATQLSMDGSSSYMTKHIYLLVSFAMAVLLAWPGYKFEKNRTSRFVLAGLFCVANLIAIVVNSL